MKKILLMLSIMLMLGSLFAYDSYIRVYAVDCDMSIGIRSHGTDNFYHTQWVAKGFYTLMPTWEGMTFDVRAIKSQSLVSMYNIPEQYPFKRDYTISDAPGTSETLHIDLGSLPENPNPGGGTGN